MKRGNTAASSTYVGPLGELLVDTGLRTIRVQDGATPGGMATLATNVQLQALGTYANATFGTSSYGNANVALYLSTSSIIGNINANVTAANVNISSLTSNAATQATLINAINANVTAANAAITSLTSNAAIQASLLDTLTGNAASQSTLLDTLTSNAATQSVSLTTLLSNAATQQTSLTDLVANAAAQSQAIANAAGTYGNANVEAYIGANIGSLWSNAAAQATSLNTITANLGAYQTYANANAATQAGSITTLQTQVYANANVASYLPTYTGNIAGNIVKNGYAWTFGTDGALTLPADAGQIGISGYTNGIDLYNNSGGTGYVRMNYADESFVWTDSGGSHIQTTGGTWDFGTDANLRLPATGYLRVGTGIVAGSLVASPAPIISGFSSISAENFKFLGNGVNILSTVTGAYTTSVVRAQRTSGGSANTTGKWTFTTISGSVTGEWVANGRDAYPALGLPSNPVIIWTFTGFTKIPSTMVRLGITGSYQGITTGSPFTIMELTATNLTTPNILTSFDPTLHKFYIFTSNTIAEDWYFEFCI